MWGGSEKKNKLHLVNKETITAPVSEEGLRLLDMSDISVALAAKWVVTYTNNRDALWRSVLGVRVILIV